MKRFRTMIGIDPSGGRLAIAAVRRGVAGATLAFPPLLHEPRAGKDPVRFEEIESVLGEYVARHGLVGAGAALVLPAGNVYLARAAFPPLKEKDVGGAVAMELERLFPLPAGKLRYAFRRLPGPPSGGKTGWVVAAAPSEFIDRWEEVVARAGLTLSAAVPAAWAVGAAFSAAGGGTSEANRAAAVLRGDAASVECSLFAAGEPFSCAVRPCAPGSAAREGILLACAGLVDPPPSAGDGPVDLIAPQGWYGEEGKEIDEGGIAFRVKAPRIPPAFSTFPGAGEGEARPDPFPLLAAYGAANGEAGMDLVAPRADGSASGTSRLVLGLAAAAAVALGIVWPSAVAWKAKTDLAALDARVAALRPAAERYEETLADLDDAQGRIAVLREEAAAAGEPLRILKELTDRLPGGTWLLSLRLEGRKVDIEGLSPSASEIFPALTRDGRFRSVEFGAPITRQADNIERFKIRGEYVPGAPSSPPPAASGTVR
ncbi:MAG: hypothetical protein OHK0028_22390 [Deltaproteobacteria bacterium]